MLCEIIPGLQYVLLTATMELKNLELQQLYGFKKCKDNDGQHGLRVNVTAMKKKKETQKKNKIGL